MRTALGKFQQKLQHFFKSSNGSANMLKQILAACSAFAFLSLLSSASGEEGFLPNTFGYDGLPFLFTTFKAKCSERLNPASCDYWDGLLQKLDDLEFSNIFKPKQTKELALENRTSGIPEENSTEEISIEIPIVDFENRLHKRFPGFRRKNPTVRGYKRGPGFRSWGGKRDPTLLGQNFNKKSKFASWGGKRDEEFFPRDFSPATGSVAQEKYTPDKRPKFQNWGGKKRTNDFLEETENKESIMSGDQMEKRGPNWKNMGFYLSEPFKKHVPKRPQFQSWGGKRALYPWPEFISFFQQKPRFLLGGGEKRKFSSWGGKRYDGNANQYEDFPSDENSKRHVFQNWGGKRGASDADSLQDIADVFAPKESEQKDGKDGR